MPDRIGADDEPEAGRGRTGVAPEAVVPPRPHRQAAVLRRRCALREGPALERSPAVPRIFSRRQRPRAGGKPPDGVDGADRPPDRTLGRRWRRRGGREARKEAAGRRPRRGRGANLQGIEWSNFGPLFRCREQVGEALLMRILPPLILVLACASAALGDVVYLK